MMTTPMIATNTNNPAIAGMKYKSDIEGGVVGAGVAVAGASTMLNVVSAFDGQKPLVPSKYA